jgi:DivIVA domain-containing protein
MDVTPQVINEVEFHQKMRGYDPDEVDDFLERVAIAVEQFQERIRAAEQRAVTAEKRAAEIEGRVQSAPAAAAAPAAPSETDETETITRTLLLAQRTADAAIKEAEDEARRTLQTANEQVQRLYAEAQEQARKLVIDAETEARKASEDTRQRLVKEIITLEETRDALRADQGILERHLDEQRLRLRSSIGELQRLLDDPGRLRVANAPELSGATLPGASVAPIDEPAGDDAPSPVDTIDAVDPFAEVVDEPVAAAIPEPSRPEPSDEVIDLAADSRVFDQDEHPITGGVTFTPPEDDITEEAGEPARAPLSAEVDDAWTRFARGELDGPPTMQAAAAEMSDDVYLSELRKAMLEDTSAGTLDGEPARARTRFGRRR